MAWFDESCRWSIVCEIASTKSISDNRTSIGMSRLSDLRHVLKGGSTEIDACGEYGAILPVERIAPSECRTKRVMSLSGKYLGDVFDFI